MRVAIVNDQRLAREALRRVILGCGKHVIAWEAADGEEAVRLCRQDLPDVVLMDLIMPGVNGAEATGRIMRETPVAILVVTCGVQTNFALVCEALGHGAFDVVSTPVLACCPPAEAGAELLAKLERVECVNRRLRCQLSCAPAEKVPPPAPIPAAAAGVPLVALGASTGGPLALAAVLTKLPPTFPAGVLAVQHMNPENVPAFVSWLRARSALDVRSACSGDRPQKGTVLVAHSCDHLVMRPGGWLAYDAEPADYPYRPSADVLFRSLAQNWPSPGVAVVLTGIGRDGAEGLLALRDAGWNTIAQDEASCVVYGMPRAAARLGAAAHILPLDGIASFLAQQASACRASLK
jgi:two-component system response regulator WspF